MRTKAGLQVHPSFSSLIVQKTDIFTTCIFWLQKKWDHQNCRQKNIKLQAKKPSNSGKLAMGLKKMQALTQLCMFRSFLLQSARKNIEKCASSAILANVSAIFSGIFSAIDVCNSCVNVTISIPNVPECKSSNKPEVRVQPWRCYESRRYKKGPESPHCIWKREKDSEKLENLLHF